MEAGALPLLVRIVSNPNENEETRRKALYATSCLIRHFPAAQFLFKNAGGFSALGNCLNKVFCSSCQISFVFELSQKLDLTVSILYQSIF